MDCEKFDRVYLELLYEELDELTSAAARRHLEHCARCRSIHSGLRATRQLSALPELDPPPGLRDRILAAEREATARLPLRRRFGRAVSIVAGQAMKPQLAMAAVALLMVGSSLVFLRGRPAARDAATVAVAEPAAVAAARPGGALATDEAARAPAAEAAAASEPAAAPAEQKRAAASGGGAYDRGLAALRAGRYAEATREFDAVADERGPNAGAAALLAAQAAQGGSGCKDAAPRYEGVALRFKNTGVAHEASWQAATCFRSLGKNDDARRNYRTLIGVAGYTERAQQALAELDGQLVAARRARPSATTGTGSGNGAIGNVRAGAAPAAKPAAAAPPAAPPNADEAEKGKAPVQQQQSF